MLVPAQDVWSSNGDGLRVLGCLIEDPQERLLGGLGHALRLWPDLEPALREVAPTGVALDTDAAFRFLRDAVPALEQAGFGVLSPAWWDKRLRLKLTAEPFKEWEEGSGLFGLDGLCAYEWRIAVGDATLSVSELRELAAMKLPLVMSRGQWIVLRSEDVEAALKFFEGRKERGKAPAAELLRESLALDAGRDELPADRDRGHRLAGRAAAARAASASSDRSRRPRRSSASCGHTSSAGSRGCRSCRASASGRVSRTTWVSERRRRRWRCCSPSARAASSRKRLSPTLLICPVSVLGNWQREAERFAPSLRVLVHHGPKRSKGRAVRGRGATCGSRAHDLRAGDCATARRWPPPSGSGSCSTRRRTSRPATRSRRGRSARSLPAIGRADGHAGREPLGRAALDHGLPQSGAARPGGGVQTLLRDADRALPRRRARPSGCGRRPARSSCAG